MTAEMLISAILKLDIAICRTTARGCTFGTDLLFVEVTAIMS
jgi:hypothetical protein